MTSKLSKRMCETELALSYYTDACALVAHDASDLEKIQYRGFEVA